MQYTGLDEQVYFRETVPLAGIRLDGWFCPVKPTISEVTV